MRRRLGVGRDRGEVRASQRVLDGSRERGVELEVVRVVTRGGEDLVDSAEDGGHPLGSRRRRGPEGQLACALLEGAVGHKQAAPRRARGTRRGAPG